MTLFFFNCVCAPLWNVLQTRTGCNQICTSLTQVNSSTWCLVISHVHLLKHPMFQASQRSNSCATVKTCQNSHLLVPETWIFLMIPKDRPGIFGSFLLNLHRSALSSKKNLKSHRVTTDLRRSIHVYPKMGASIHGVPMGILKWMVYFMDNPINKWMMTGGTSISGNLHMLLLFIVPWISRNHLLLLPAQKSACASHGVGDAHHAFVLVHGSAGAAVGNPLRFPGIYIQ